MDGAQQTEDRGYRVLARKYRPTRFDDLVGQEPMVRTLSNAFAAGRIAQAWMLTGVRGVGKTTTARILARALNYEIPGQIDQPTIDMPDLGTHCQAIMEGRHVDVIEMDAASHTGINDIREITEAARYKPVSARYKVYIIDEVHMLSNQAFNGLLKTLEEPPEHVKFLFATTEIRKVPVTVLSRCQRFDLRRIDADRMVQFLQKIADSEAVGIEPEAQSMIARAAEGSARDALSLLDQAIAHGAETVSGDTVRSMLGLADRARVIDLFEAVMRGDIALALEIVKEQFDIGAEPAIILTDLAEFTHLVTKFKISDDYEGGQAVTELERTRGGQFAESLSMRVLSRAWQILLKGIGEVQTAPRPLAAADMVLVRLCYAADLPTPDEVARQLRAQQSDGSAAPGNGTASQAPQTPSLQTPSPQTSSPQPSSPQSSSPQAQSSPVQSPQIGAAEAGRPVSPPLSQADQAPSVAPVPPTEGPGPANPAGPTAYAASNVVSGSFGQTGGAALRKPDPQIEPEPAPAPQPDPVGNDDAVEVPDVPGVAGDRAEPKSEPVAGPVEDDAGPPHRIVQLSSLREIADLLGENRDLKLKFAVERQIRPVAMQPGKLEISVEPGAPPDLAQKLAMVLQDNTGMRWMVVVSRETGGQTLHEIEQREQARVMSDAAAHPDVAAVLSAFPGAKIVDVRISPREGESAGLDADDPGFDDPALVDPGLDDPDFDD